ncbi:MAG TPA: alanine racemase [Acidimicrobiales bacterium]|jgi:alanine racemase|nr:alanine racemase [Acidimicrobiales bacterium]
MTHVTDQTDVQPAGDAAGGSGPGEKFGGGGPGLRPVWAEVDLDAIAYNAGLLAKTAGPAALCAVVKADGYGHGAVPVARAALRGGAHWLAVALVEEGLELRDAGIDAPILILSEPTAPAMPDVVAARLTPSIYTQEGIDAAGAAVSRTANPRGAGTRSSPPLPVHVKVDTGMHRVGAFPDEALRLATAVDSHPALQLEGLFTHLAVADEVGDPYTAEQLARFEAVVAGLAVHGVTPRLRHAANSAGALWHPDARLDLVRCGISLYGLSPCAEGAGDAVVAALRPALSLRARVSHVKTLDGGARVSYGLRYTLPQRSVIATVPIGYADGVPRRLGAVGGEVLVGGRRRPVAGTVTMDQLLVDCGPGAGVAVGDEVVLIGAQGGEAISAWEWAERTDTIAYEVVCGLSQRVPRAYRTRER